MAAHGSWDAGTLPTQPPRLPPAPSDLLGFKAHFQGCTLPADLMPLLAFPGGYGGMVHEDGGRVSLSCCVRRDQLTCLRHTFGQDAGDAVLGHILKQCFGVRLALRNARREGPWLAAGPIRPGMRLLDRGGIFPVGNAAGEAHPVIAEGISIAMQSAWLLARRLHYWKRASRRQASGISDCAACLRRRLGARHFRDPVASVGLVRAWGHASRRGGLHVAAVSPLPGGAYLVCPTERQSA